MISRTLIAVAVGASLTFAGCKNAVDVRQQVVYDIQSRDYDRAIPKLNDLYDCVLAGELAKPDAGKPETADDITEKNELLWRMERGAIETQRGDVRKAALHLDRASQLVVERRTASLTREIGTYLTNDTAQEYAGNGFEHVLVDYHRTLAAALAAERLLGILPARGEEPYDLDMASQRMNNIARGMVLERIQFNKDNAPDLRYFDDPFARVMAACMVLATPPELRARDDLGFAFTQLANACRAYKKQATVLGGADGQRYEVHGIPDMVRRLTLMVGGEYDPEGLARLLKDLGVEVDGDSVKTAGLSKDQGLVLVLNHADWITPTDKLDINLTVGVLTGPTLTEAEIKRGVTTTAIHAIWTTFWAKGPNSEAAKGWGAVLATAAECARIFGDLAPGTWIGFEIPAHRSDVPIPSPGTAVIGTIESPLAVVDDLDAYARATLKDLQPGVLTKTLARVMTKHLVAEAAAQGAREATKDQGSGAQILGWLAGIGAHAAASASEAADTRHWGILPDRIEAALVTVPAGKHMVSIRLANGTEQLGEVTVPAGRLVVVGARTFPNPVPSPYPGGK